MLFVVYAFGRFFIVGVNEPKPNGPNTSCLLPYQPSPHQSPTFGLTFYKFSVTGLLGLDSVRRWAQSEKLDPTLLNTYVKI